MWEAIKRAIEENSNFLLCTHRDPDADGIGSELTLRHALQAMGKKAVILNPDSLPSILKFMDPEGVILAFGSLSMKESMRLLDEAEVILFLDSGVWQRLYPMDRAVAARVGKVFCIDHHPAENALTGGSVVRESASSTGELIYELLKELGHSLDERIAFWLYCAIVKDTGSFRFENTNAKVFKIAGELLEYGVSPHEVYDSLFERSSINSVICLGRVLGTLSFAYGNRLAYIYLTRKMLEETGADFAESDTYINAIRSIDPVEACLFFRETNDGQIKVSLRSKSSEIDVNKLAGKFGGGGHKRASGALIPGSLNEVIEKVVSGAAEFFA
ncbi:MAG TPA: bifunctional oligoribonuclease/PAP phosphatase NrnA [archaeon]|nr:bifunctional oligoribonuclease/PAP phosphatase NrnA [archaeon]